MNDVNEELEQQEPKKRRGKTPVRVIASEGKSCLVEHISDGDVVRVYLPVEDVVDGKCSKSALNAGVPYGVPWEQVITSLPAELVVKLATALRAKGFWTSRDIEIKPKKVDRAVLDAVGITSGHLHHLAKTYEKED